MRQGDSSRLRAWNLKWLTKPDKSSFILRTAAKGTAGTEVIASSNFGLHLLINFFWGGKFCAIFAKTISVGGQSI